MKYKTSTSIKELTTEQELTDAYPVMHQLRTHLDEGTYLELVKEARDKEGYRMYALYDNSEIVAVIGYMPQTTLYYGRFIWICDFVTDTDKRSKGYGKKLLAFVHDKAKEEGYENVALSSGLKREAAHRFYEDKMNYHKASYVFKWDMDE